MDYFIVPFIDVLNEFGIHWSELDVIKNSLDLEYKKVISEWATMIINPIYMT